MNSVFTKYADGLNIKIMLYTLTIKKIVIENNF